MVKIKSMKGQEEGDLLQGAGYDTRQKAEGTYYMIFQRSPTFAMRQYIFSPSK
jgi:hypothetical protein